MKDIAALMNVSRQTLYNVHKSTEADLGGGIPPLKF